MKEFKLKGGKAYIPKHPRSEVYHGADLTDWCAERGTTIVSVTGTATGVTVIGDPFPAQNGTAVAAKFGTLDLMEGAENFYEFRFTCANGEIGVTTIHFDVEEQ